MLAIFVAFQAEKQLLKGHLFIQESLLNIYYKLVSGREKTGIETVFMACTQVGER